MTKKEFILYAMENLFWRCGDCKNLYTVDVDHCPNTIIDDLMVNKFTSKTELDGIAK